MDLTTQLIALAQEFIDRTPAGKRPPSLRILGTRAAGDHKFFLRLQDGKSTTIQKYESVREWLTANMPVESDAAAGESEAAE